MNLTTMKLDDAISTATHLLKMKESFLFVGPPGIGKTMAIKKAIVNANMAEMIFHPAVDDPTDYKGLPMKTGPDSADFITFGSLKKLQNAKVPTACFFDDLGQAPTSVQAPIMQVWLGREINGKKVSPEVVFCGATNRRQDNAGVGGFLTPLIDRITMVMHIGVDAKVLRQYAISQDWHPAIVGHLGFAPQLLEDSKPSREISKHATPRSLEALNRCLKIGMNNYFHLVGCVGEEYAAHFKDFQRTYLELPTLEQIVANPMKAKIPSKGNAGAYYAVAAMIGMSINKKIFAKLTAYLERIPPEYSVMSIKDALERDKTVRDSKEFSKWVDAHRDLLGDDSDD